MTIIKRVLILFLIIFSLPAHAQRPNIVLIMADDMGYSDIGCYGSEIPTPNIDRLAQQGVKFRHFYNGARCCPSRASLMTGLFPHQTGIGHMTDFPSKPNGENWGTPGYLGHLNYNCVTMAEALGSAGYHTYMAGKWHLGMHSEEQWPLQRGFEKYYGILAGAASYFRPKGDRGLTYNNTRMPEPEGEYYTTDAFTDSAIAFVNGQKDEKPFFLYLAFNAPHWPLQAKESDIKKFAGVYDKGWDAIREQRFARQKKLGITNTQTLLSGRDPAVRPWTALTATERKEVAYRMQVYAAQVSCMDQNIGKLIKELEKKGKLDNTVIIFLSDNGACPEPYKELGGGAMADINDGSKMAAISYGMGWANASNTPYRKWKTEVEEGGVSAPFVVSWPKGHLKNATIVDTTFYLIDVLPTVMELTKASYPREYKGHQIQPLEGFSFVPVLKGMPLASHPWMYWEHQGNQAIRKGKWKAVKDHDKTEWSLFDLMADRTEEKDLSAVHPEIVKELSEKWEEWAKSHAVLPKHAAGTTPAAVSSSEGKK